MSGRLFCLMGKSASGKDTIYEELLRDRGLSLRPLVPYTTRPMRDGEENGREYFFTGVKEYQSLKDRGLVLESRCYQTIAGPWYYYTVKDRQLDLSKGSVLAIETLESYLTLRAALGGESVVPLYIELDDGERLERALHRERAQKTPHYEEMCRRFLADQKDFSEENLALAGITRRFVNKDLDACTAELAAFIRSYGEH